MYAHDWEAVGGFFTAEAHYMDVGTSESGGGAHGPAQIVARLRLGLEPVERHTHEPGLVVAEGSVVVTEHLEVWWFHTGEVVRHPFTSGDGTRRRRADHPVVGLLQHVEPARQRPAVVARAHLVRLALNPRRLVRPPGLSLALDTGGSLR